MCICVCDNLVLFFLLLCAFERVTGRKARGLQMEKTGCICQTFVSLLSCRRKQTSIFFFPSLYKFKRRFLLKWTSLVAQTVKRLCTMWETWVPSLGREDPLEKEMAIHSITIAWKIPWTEEPIRLQSMGSQRVGHD